MTIRCRQMMAPAHHIIKRCESAAYHAIKRRLGREGFHAALHRGDVIQLQLVLHLTQEAHALAKAVQQGEM